MSDSQNHGLIHVEPVKGDYVAGSRLRLGGAAVVPGGQWDEWVPQDEIQRLTVETYSCTSFGTLNAVEILEHQEYGDKKNLSDRFLSTMSDTTVSGNDPHKVAETLRKKGCVREADWPFDQSIKTLDEYHAPIPRNVETAALEFIAEYNFGHEWVNTDPQSMMNALEYSPLGVDVYAWKFDYVKQVYVRPQGAVSGHWVCVYGYVPGQYWKCFDSYDSTHKKLAWNFGFSMVKKYTLHRQVVVESAWQTFIRLFRQICNLPAL